jgi:hypothetical protein
VEKEEDIHDKQTQDSHSGHSTDGVGRRLYNYRYADEHSDPYYNFHGSAYGNA